MSRGKNYCIYQ